MATKRFTGTVVATLCILIRNGRILMARKVKNVVVGRWAAYGGRLDPGERVRRATVREISEETDYQVVVDEEDLEYFALVHFHNVNDDGTPYTFKVHVYLAGFWMGEARESKEMKTPTWFDCANLPWEEMPIADPHWLPLVLSGHKVIAHFHHGPKQETLLREPEIQIVETLPEPD